MPAVAEHQEAFQAKQQRENRHQHERVHHDTALPEERLEFLAPGKFLRVGNRVLDRLVLQYVQRDRDNRGSPRGLRYGLLYIRGHLRRERRVPFEYLALQCTRAEQRLHLAVILRDLAQKDRTQAQAVHVHVGAVAHLRSLAPVELRVGQFMTQQQVVHKILHRADRIRHLLLGILGSLLQAD